MAAPARTHTLKPIKKEVTEWWRHLCGRTLLIMYETAVFDYRNVALGNIGIILHVVVYIAFYMYVIL